MKVTINIDCTPLEARQFMGLPDLEPMQKAILDSVQSRMMKEIESYTPEKFIEAWLPMMTVNRDWMRSLYGAFMPSIDGSKS